MYLIFAILIICLAHIIRVFRWELLIETYEKPDVKRLTKSLSLGYFLNYFIPFKLGDLVRAIYAGTRMKNGRGFALATVIVERCLDVITVGIMFLVMEMTGFTSGEAFLSSTTGYYIILAAAVFIFLVIVFVLKKYIKKLIYVVGSEFNEKLEEKILRFFWALIWGFKDILNRLPKFKLIFYTIVMWGLYLSSYWAFAMFLESSGINSSLTDVFMSLFDQGSLLSSGISGGAGFDIEAVLYAVFMILPLILMASVTMFIEHYFKASNAIEIDDEKDGDKRINLLPQANIEERRLFLKMYFAGEKKEYIDNYLKINRNILVLRDYSAGSNATTILCTDGKKSFYRKYAFSDAALKLNEQITWINEHKEILPLAEIIRSDVNEVACFYDMPYSPQAVTMFDFAHSCKKEKSWEVLKNVLGTLDEKLYVKECDSGSKEELAREYINKKITKNYEEVISNKNLSNIVKYKTVVINDREYKNLPEYREIFEEDALLSVFKNDSITDIHGDLTIENIVCVKENETNDAEAFYLIDPNTGNIFNSKFIDYAKILQSLHGGYEFLMAVSDVSVEGNHIDFKYFKSEAYEYLYGRYCEYLKENFSEDEVKSIYFHEVVNWLRLMPYKIKKGSGELFYAGLLMILDDLPQ